MAGHRLLELFVLRMEYEGGVFGHPRAATIDVSGGEVSSVGVTSKTPPLPVECPQ